MKARPNIALAEIARVIRHVQARLVWKPGSAREHLIRRIRRGHLPATATVDEYEAIIRTTVQNAAAQVYLFWHKDTPYISIVDNREDRQWLVMFGIDGVLESAYIVERPNLYLSKVEFEYVDLLSKVMSYDDD